MELVGLALAFESNDPMIAHNVNLHLDLTQLAATDTQQLERVNEVTSSSNNEQLTYDERIMESARSDGILRGYLVKAAQTLSKFQRKKFYRRYYELNVETRYLKVFEKDGGGIKDSIQCDVAHVVTSLNKDLHLEYKDFFAKDSYHGTTIELPSPFTHAFAVFFESGSMQVLFAANESDYQEWTTAFKQMCCDTEKAFSNGVFQYSDIATNIPIPEQTEQNYFVATLYLALLPEQLTETDINGIKTERSRMTLTPFLQSSKAPAEDVQIVVTPQTVKGYLIKTVQGNSILKTQKLLTRWYCLNAHASTLYIADNPNDNDGTTIEFRTNRLAHVETALSSRICELAEFEGANESKLLGGRTQPIALIFTNGNLMLLWAKPGKEHKYWTRALKRFVKPDSLGEDENPAPRCKTVFLTQKPENSFVLSVFQRLLPDFSLDFTALQQQEHKTIEGWLCKTTPKLPSDSDEKPFLKAYCVFDFFKKHIFLCDKNNGQIVEKLAIDGNLRYVDTNLIGKINNTVKHQLVDQRILKNVQLPLAFIHPFALVFGDGSLHIFWAQSEKDANRWKTALAQVVPDPRSYNSDFANYVLRTKSNTLLTTLYIALGRKADVEEEVVEVQELAELLEISQKDDVEEQPEVDKLEQFEVADEEIEGNLVECVKQDFVERRFKLCVASKRLSVFSEENQLAYEIDLVAGRSVSHVVTNLRQSYSAAEAELVDTGDDITGQIELPSFLRAPIAVFFTDGEFLLLWAVHGEVREQFVEAFESMAAANAPVEKLFWSEMNSDNAFKLNIYRCLLPDLDVAVQTTMKEQQIETKARITIPRHLKPEANKTDKFLIRYLRLKKQVIKISNNSDYKFREYKLPGRLCSIDTDLTSKLIAGYKDNILGNYVDADGELELPKDDYSYPLALTFVDGDMLLVWLDSRETVVYWKAALEGFLPSEQPDFNLLVIGQHNEFVATLYKSLKRMLQPPRPTIELLQVNQQKASEESKGENMAQSQVKNREASTQIVNGWLSRTKGKTPAWGQEPFDYRYFKLSMLTGVLTEHEDQKKQRRLNEFILHRKIVFVEADLSNDLQGDYESIFQHHCSKPPPPGFALPAINVKPICLHLVDGDIILLWASAKREYAKWLEAFQTLQLPITSGGSRKRLLLKITQQNCFTASVFSSMKPAKTTWKESSTVSFSDIDISGRCLKTAQSTSTLQSDYVFERLYSLDFAEKKLMIMKSHKANGQRKTHDLSSLRWIDATLTQKFEEGFKSIFMRDDVSLGATEGKFTQVRNFLHPLALGMREGNMTILWFQTIAERSQMYEALATIARSNSEQGCLTHDYIIQTKTNNFVASLYQVLKPSRIKDPEKVTIVKGTLGLAMNKKEPVFVNRFMTLNIETGILSIYPQPYEEVEDELDLRFVVTMHDFNHKRRELKISPSNTVSLTLNDRVFAVHNGNRCLVFCAKDPEQFSMWSTALAKVEVPQFRDSELWIDGTKGIALALAQSICNELSRKKAINTDKADGIEEEFKAPSGFLCKTAQSLDKKLSRGKIFYKRHYMIDESTSELLVSNSPDSAVKERFPLNQLIKVDASLKQTLCPEHRLYFRQHISTKITTPRDFAHPFCLLFEGGQVQLLWASSSQELTNWTQSLKRYEIKEARQYQLMMRHSENFITCTMYLCLKPDTPTILLSTKPEAKNDEMTEDSPNKTPLQNEVEVQLQEEECKDNIADAMISAQGAIEGWLYKSSQNVGMFQNEVFHKRFYRLDIRTGALKVYSSQDGKVKQTIELSSQIVKVDGNLRRSLTSNDAEYFGLGRSVCSPSFTFPFAVFTKMHTFVLWTDKADSRVSWVNAFKGIMLGTDASEIASFQIKKEKKNKFVTDLYECLKEPDFVSLDKNSMPWLPDPVKPEAGEEVEKVDISPENIALQEMVPEDKKEKADLQRHLSEMANDDDFPVSAFDIKQLASLPNKKVKNTSSGQKENKRTQSLGSIEFAKLRQSKNQTMDAQDSEGIADIVSAIKDMRASVHRPPRQKQQMSVNDAPPFQEDLIKDVFTQSRMRQPAFHNSSVIISQRQADGSTNQSDSDSRPSRKLRLPSASSGRGPIKIKKMIPLKDTTQNDVNRQSIKSVFTGPGHRKINSLTERDGLSCRYDQTQGETITTNQDDDDDIERDPACEIIKAPFRRFQKAATTGRKIKVKLRGRSSASSRLPTNELFVSEQRNEQLQQSNVIMRLNFNKPEVGGNFEDHVNKQVEKDFVDNLLSRSGKRSNTGKSAWGEVAQSLRDKIKVTANNKLTEQLQLLQQQSSSSSIPVLSNREGGNFTSRRSQALPIKAVASVNIKEASDTSINADLRKSHNSCLRSAAATRNDHPEDQMVKEQQLSDWDDSEEGETDGRSSHMSKHRRVNTSFVNVRDHTSGLFNVFNSQLLTKSNFDYSLSKQKSAMMPQQLFRSSYRRSEAALNATEVEPIQVDLKEPDFEEEIPENDPIADNQQNAEDCIAESYRSVWD